MPDASSGVFPQLAVHVRACRVGDQLIFLDLLRSKYIGVGGPLLSSLERAILEEPFRSDAVPTACSPGLLSDWFERLRSQNLLSDSPERRPVALTVRAIEAKASLNAENVVDHGPFSWRDLLLLWRATFVASMWIRHRSLADIARKVATLRARYAGSATDTRPDALLAAVASYVRLRPLALTTHDRCLNDSLTLVHFLATQGIFPRWVIGVRVHPFAAHSWVQSADVVVNDLAERVRHYKPILVV